MTFRVNTPPTVLPVTGFKAVQQTAAAVNNAGNYTDLINAAVSPAAVRPNQTLHYILIVPYIKTTAGDDIGVGIWNGSEFIGGNTDNTDNQLNGVICITRSQTLTNVGDTQSVNCAFARITGSGTVTVSGGIVIFVLV